MRDAESSLSCLLRICLVTLLVTFVSQRNLYAVEADKQAPEKPTTKGDYALMVKKNLRRLNANDASAKDVLEKMGRKAKIDALVTIPETEKISVSFKKLTIEDAAARLSRNTRCRRIQEEAISRSAIFIYYV
jgi:hypothetical protein